MKTAGKDVYVERDLEKEISKYIKSREIIAVVGARQCGKTTMLNVILDREESRGKRINRLSFENQAVLNLFEADIEGFIDKHVKNFDILFIDEIQYSKDSGKRLKYLYDSFNIKIVLTGSSAIDVSLNSLKFLVGRIFIFILYPFSFKEFLRAKNERLHDIYQKNKYGEEILKELNAMLEEFIVFGGYPRAVIAEDKEEKKKILQDIYGVLLLREVKDLTGLSENQKLISFMKALSLQIGNLVDYSELGSLSGFELNQIKKIFKVLEDSFICKRLNPFSRNKRTELYKNPKVYFFDNGLRNASLDSFEFAEKGQLYENFTFSELIKKEKKFYFWRTKSKAEVDFVVEENLNFLPLEIKSKIVKPVVTRSYSSFLEKYNPKEGYFLSLNFEGKKKFGNCMVEFLPFVKFVERVF